MFIISEKLRLVKSLPEPMTKNKLVWFKSFIGLRHTNGLNQRTDS